MCIKSDNAAKLPINKMRNAVFSDKWGGVDALKILSCIGVLAYHVLDDFCLAPGHDPSRVAYFLASFCVPMFFTASGFTFGRNSFSTEYVEKKIGGILKKLLGWIIFWCVVYVFIYGLKTNPFIDFIDGSFGGGVLPVSWFIFTLCLCWLFGYPVFILHEKHRPFFYVLTVVLLEVMVLKRSGFVAWNIPFYDRGTQAAWFGLYFTFFITGMLLRDISQLIVRNNAAYKILLALALAVMSYIYAGISAFSGLWPHQFYGHWAYMIWFILLFVCAMNLCPYSKFMHVASMGTLAVYLWHLPVLLYAVRFIHVTSGAIGTFMIISLFVSGEIFYLLFRNYPLFRKML